MATGKDKKVYKKEATDSSNPPAPVHAILYPAWTSDYAVANGKLGGGFGVIALQKIRKGDKIYSESLEYTFTAVLPEGDHLLFDRHRKASKKSQTDVPRKFPLTRDTLHRTHGVPCLDKASMTVTWQLEVPGMLMNHSCNPNVQAYPRSSDKAEDYAARDIKEGDELTVDYALQYYDHGPLFEKCLCGESNCRGSMMGFVALSDSDKERLFPLASDAVQAMHLAATGKGPPVQTVHKTAQRPASSDGVPRLVFPGPSHAWANVIVKQDDEIGQFGLYALKDFKSGDKVYEFWSQSWPRHVPAVVDMVFAAPLTEGDPPEGTVVRIDAAKSAAKDRTGHYMLSGWAMLTEHSCDPNLVYKEDEEHDWQTAYAARDIKAGDQLTVDYNCVLWDRSESIEDGCDCGSSKCTGTKMGFKFLPRDAQEERKLMSWRRVAPPYEGSKGKVIPGEALSPHVRVSWREDSELGADAPETGSSSSEDESD